ncbi:MAG: fatty acid CoA ligase family protein [Polyangiaceae bacterium]
MRRASDLGIAPELYPFEGHYFDHGGMWQHYLDEGEGEPVVMVHGNPTWSFYYRSLVLELRRDHRCIVPDHIGCGLSDMPGEGRYDYRLRSRIDDLERLLDDVVPEEAVNLVVHDWGGMIGMGWAVRHPERVKRLVILNTAAFHLPEHMTVPSPVAIVRDTALAGLFVRGMNAFARGAAHTCTTRRPMPPRVRDAYCAPYDSWDHRLATLRFVQDIPLSPRDPSFDTVSEVERGLERLVDKPALLCWGGKDFVFDNRVLTEWRQRLPHARVEELPDCGHYVLEDAPREVAARTRHFFATSTDDRPETIVNIASCLPEIASRDPERVAIRFPVGADYRAISYGELDRQSDVLAAGLIASGIGRGVRTALMVTPSPELFTLSFAIAKAGAVPVMVDPGIGLRHLKQCLAEAQIQAFIGIPAAHAARATLGWGRETLLTTVSVGGPFPGALTLDTVQRRGEARVDQFSPAPTLADDVAAILFTSGSTGPPKGAEYTHGNFDAQIRLLRQISRIGEEETDLPTFPVFALFDPALGMTTVIPDMDPRRPAEVDPDAIIDPIQRFGITNMFASPALLARVAEHMVDDDGHPRTSLPSLRRVVSAGAPVHADVIRRFSALLADGTPILTPYGATEALPVSLIGSDERLSPEVTRRSAEGGGICVGRVVPETEVAIIAIDDGPIDDWEDARVLPQGHVGEIVVAGPQVTTRYYGRPEATRRSKIRDGHRVRHRMGDVGYVDDEGRLWFCGRKSHRVPLSSGETLFPVPCEVVFNAHPAVRRSAVVGPRRRGEVVPTVIVELRDPLGWRDRRRLRDELATLARSHPLTRPVREVLFHRAFPVDIRHNAKIDRLQLAQWAQEQLK